jgi:uncharacterized membrane protein YgcG
MKMSKSMAIGAAGLALGLVIGGISTASAASTAATGTTSANPIVGVALGLGLRLGKTMRDSGGRLADVVAKLTGSDVADVQTAREAGTSFADIAKDKGVSAETVVDEALKARKELLDAKVADGSITQEQADAALANMETRLTDRVTSTDARTGGQGGGRRGGGGGNCGTGGGGAGGCGGGACQSTATQ